MLSGAYCLFLSVYIKQFPTKQYWDSCLLILQGETTHLIIFRLLIFSNNILAQKSLLIDHHGSSLSYHHHIIIIEYVPFPQLLFYRGGLFPNHAVLVLTGLYMIITSMANNSSCLFQLSISLFILVVTCSSPMMRVITDKVSSSVTIYSAMVRIHFTVMLNL